MANTKCPRIRFVRENHGHHARVIAFAGTRQVGHITLNNKLSVGSISVDLTLRRCGLGTRLYEKAAKIACTESGSGLRSDDERTVASQGFWEKQVRKGRAVCSEEYTGPSPKGAVDESLVGRGGCYFYTLKCPAPVSLAGRRRRQR